MEPEKYKKDRSSRSTKASKSSSSKYRSRDHSSSPPASQDDNIGKRKHVTDDGDEQKSSHRRSDNQDDRQKRKRRDEEKTSNMRQDDGDHGSGGGGATEELSIEETNKLREKLGLKPLTITDSNKPTTETKSKTGEIKKTYLDQDTNQEFEHVPAKNMSEAKEQKTLREKLREKREQRELNEKVLKSKGLGCSDDEEDKEDSAVAWLEKVKQKQEALKKAKLLEEMDEQFGISEAAETTKKPTISQRNYDSRHLKGLRVEHDQAMFKEGKEIILTLKDRNILQGSGENLDVDNDEDADVLVNVNLMDDEAFSKNVENKKKKPGYQAYEEFDEEGLFKEKSILDKYNEELEGVKKKSFKLDKGGGFDASDQKFLEKLDEEHRAKAIRIDALNELKYETDYLTPAELEKFKKPKKIRKVLRNSSKKNKSVKADDLLPLAVPVVIKKEQPISVKNEPVEAKNPLSLKNIDFGLDEDEADEVDSEESESESEDELKLNQDQYNNYKEMVDEEMNALDELQSILAKSRNKVTSSNLKVNNLERIIQIKQEEEAEAESAEAAKGVNFDALNTLVEEDNDRTMYLDTMSEFCKNLGRNSGAAEEAAPVSDEEEEEVVKKEEENMQPDSEMETSEDEILMEDANESTTNKQDKSKENEDEFELLEDEPTLDRGLASFLSLCKNKGFIDEQSKAKKGIRPKKESLEAVNYTIEEKNYYDIDDKYNRNRDRYGGPTSDFQEKSNYKPSVKLDYIDEKGHSMNEKEAFRYLSHKFHGKGSGKKKTEKQQNKYKEKDVMAKMSSVDTPLNTVAMLVEKQKRLQQPYVVLSATKGKQEQITLHKR